MISNMDRKYGYSFRKLIAQYPMRSFTASVKWVQFPVLAFRFYLEIDFPAPLSAFPFLELVG